MNYLPVYLINESSDTFSTAENKFIDRSKSARMKLDDHIDLNYIQVINEEKIMTEPEHKLSIEEIYVNIFKRYGSVTNNEDNITTQYITQIDTEDINLSSFLSSVNFVDHLCNICEVIRSTNPLDQHKTLLNEIKKVNKILPANIYIPFLNDSIRYYVIGQIPVSEIKIFKTKNRAPFMITVEAFRLEEITE
jgi:hypothetical protein